MSLDDLVENPIGAGAGWATSSTAVILQTASAFGVDQINPWLTLLLSVGGFVFLVLKIKNMRLRNKILKNQIDREKHETDN